MSISGTMMIVMMMIITTMMAIIVDLIMMATIVLLESPVEKSYGNDQNRVQWVGAFEICWKRKVAMFGAHQSMS